MRTPPVEQGDAAVLKQLGKTEKGRVIFANEQTIIVRCATGHIIHLKFDAALNDWTCGGRRMSIAREGE